MKVKRSILVITIALLVCSFVPSPALADFGSTDSKNLQALLTNFNTASNNAFGWRINVSGASAGTPGAYLKSLATNIDTFITSYNNYTQSLWGWNKQTPNPLVNTPLYWLKGIYDKLNDGTESGTTNNYSSQLNDIISYQQSTNGLVSDIKGSLNNGSGSGSVGGTGSGVEDWATLFGWLSSINGNQSLIYGELQTISDRILEISPGGNEGEYIEQLEGISTILETIAPQIRDITTVNDEATLKNIANVTRSYVIAIKTNTDDIKTTLTNISNDIQSIETYASNIPAITTLLDNSFNNDWGWNKQNANPLVNSPAYWLKSINENVETIPGYLTNDSVWGWSKQNANPLVNTPAYWLKSIRDNSQDIPVILQNFSDAYWGWNKQNANPLTNSPAYWLKSIRDSTLDIPDILQNYSDSYWGWNKQNPNPLNNSPAYWLKGIYDKLNNWTNSGGTMPEQPWTVVVQNLPLSSASPAYLRVHDEVVTGNLADIGSKIDAVIAILRTPDVSDVVGDFDYDELLSNADALRERLATLAPFGAAALMAAMLAIWAGSGVLQTPRFDVPFDFAFKGNVVNIDLSWLEAIKPVIDFFMISLLIFCLVNASMRIIELEAAK